ncbi:hypothetical protein HW115_02905 [Verrucomicrobiaceae bacterium N1E253]|uniref:Uncharacterized protein n=1 Tax=Oceaniferula marina TaxID=2748318 RepID=A0A851GK47_9BACT|nr:hypothetical protein [Oceaniferula marina]NWK54544.1 hypothetical protein [Oceaniferula marina]
MKRKPHIKASSTDRGFALIATISVMVLLMMIVLAIITLSTIEVRSANNDNAMEEARVNARLALMLAIGELQKHTGQDQRSTARADIFDPDMANGSWIGVWHSSKMPDDLSTDIVTRDDDTGSLLDARSGNDTSLFFDNPLTWLVSGEDPIPGEPLSSPVSLRRAVTSASTDSEVPEITVERVPVYGKSGQVTGSYAWYVDDLSLKANISHDNRKERPVGLQEAGGENIAPYFAPHGVGNFHHGDLVSLKKKAIAKLATLGTVGVAVDDNDLPRDLAADYTHYSISLLTDSLNGGLKKDLIAYAKYQASKSNAALPAWGSYGSITKDYNILESNPNLALNKGFHTTYGPKLGLIKSWLNLPVTGSGNSYSVDPVAPVRTGYDLGADAGVGADAGDSDLKAMTGSSILQVPDIKNNTSAAVHPVMTLCENEMHLLYEEDGSGKITVGNPAVDTNVNFYKLHYGFFPKVVLWNPYNVTINAKNYYVQSKYPKVMVCRNVQKIGTSWLISTGPIDSQVDKALVADFGKVLSKRWVVTSDSTSFENPISTPMFKIECPALAPGEYLEFIPQSTVDWNAATRPGDLILAPSSYGVGIYDKCFKVEAGLVSEPSVQTSSFKGTEDKMVRLAVAQTSSVNSIQYAGTPKGKVTFKRTWFLYDGEAPHSDWSDIKNNNDLYQSVLIGEEGYKYVKAPYDTTNLANNKRMFDLNDKDTWLRSMSGVFGYRYIYLDENWDSLNVYGSQFLPIAPVANANVRASWYVPGAVNSRSGNNNDTLGKSRLVPPLMEPSVNHNQNFAKLPRADFNTPSPFTTKGTLLGVDMVLFDLPKPDYGVPSLGMLQHLNYSPFIWHSSYTLGNSYADIRYDREKTSVANSSGMTGNIDLVTQGSSSDQLLYYDLAYELNFNMWDRFFMSSQTKRNTSSNTSMEWNPTLPDLGKWVSPYLLMMKSRESDIAAEEGYHRVAEYLGVPGGFNPNSTSVNAWKSFLSSASTSDYGYNGKGEEKMTVFSRSHPAQGDNLDVGSDTLQDDSYWNGFRELDDDQLTKLAEHIVEEVRARGPFLSVGDFVNRRLDSRETGLSGALQAAIDKSGLNGNDSGESFVDLGLGRSSGGGELDYYDHYYGSNKVHSDIASLANVEYEGLSNFPKSRTRNMAGHLQQGDILQALGPRLSTRGDSFLIRVYGESKNGTQVTRAYAEAVVQRIAEPVDPDWDGIGPEPSSSQVQHGRKFEMISFRWLNVNEL